MKYIVAILLLASLASAVTVQASAGAQPNLQEMWSMIQHLNQTVTWYLCSHSGNAKRSRI